MRSGDAIQRFVFPYAGVRGELVHLDATWQSVLTRHHYPPVLRRILGQFMAAGALLSATLKYSGSLILQVQSDGPVKLLVVEATSDRTMRATAQWSSLPDDDPPGNASLARLFDGGKLVITVDPKQGRERYQGIVELTGDSVAEILEHYLMRSEQLDTRLWLAADDSTAAGMLLQRLPDRASDDADAWPRAVHLASTVSAEELIGLPHKDLLRRLFHQEHVRLFDPAPMRFECSCSRERVANVIKMLGYDEAQSILSERSAVTADCEFCNQRYRFDPVDIEQLFAADSIDKASPTRH